MQPYGDNFIPVIPSDHALHDEEHPFCTVDPSCSCHENDELVAQVNQYVQDGLLTPDEATDFVLGKLI